MMREQVRNKIDVHLMSCVVTVASSFSKEIKPALVRTMR